MFLTDLARAVFDVKGMGTELSRRSAGLVLGTFALVCVVYGSVTGLWYAKALSHLAGIVVEEVKAHVPPIVIQDGTLTSSVEQPYIITEENLRPEFSSRLVEWARRWFHANYAGNPATALRDLTGGETHLFCFVLDTTGTYPSRITPKDYTFSVVLTGNEAIISGERSGGMREERIVRYSEIQQPLPVAIDSERVDVELVKREVWKGFRFWFPVISLLLTLARFAVKALIAGLIGVVLAQLTGKGLTFQHTLSIAVYALVPVVLLAFIRLAVVAYPGWLLFLAHWLWTLVPVALYPKPDTARPAPA